MRAWRLENNITILPNGEKKKIAENFDQQNVYASLQPPHDSFKIFKRTVATLKIGMEKLYSVQFSVSQKIKKGNLSQRIVRINCALGRRRPVVSLKLELPLYYPVLHFAQSSDKIPGTKWKLCISRKFRTNSLSF